jgi:hypothetical protein
MEAETFVEGGYPVEPYTEVIPGLFLASAAHSPAEMLSMFDVLIDVGGRDRWAGDPDPRYSFHPLDDVPFIADAEMIHRVGERIASLVIEGKHVAVNCLSGVNRSGLLVGRALVELGCMPEEAIEAVRSARGPMALSNQHFVRFLLVDCTPEPWHDVDSCRFRSDPHAIAPSGPRPHDRLCHAFVVATPGEMTGRDVPTRMEAWPPTQ